MGAVNVSKSTIVYCLATFHGVTVFVFDIALLLVSYVVVVTHWCVWLMHKDAPRYRKQHSEMTNCYLENMLYSTNKIDTSKH